MKFSKTASLVAVLACGISLLASAQEIVFFQAMYPSLEAIQAVERSEWWLRCRTSEVQDFVMNSNGGSYTKQEAAEWFRSTYLYTAKGSLQNQLKYPVFASRETSTVVFSAAPTDRDASCSALPPDFEVFGLCKASSDCHGL